MTTPTLRNPGPCRGCGTTLPLSSKMCPTCGRKNPVGVFSTLSERGQKAYLLVMAAVVVGILVLVYH